MKVERPCRLRKKRSDNKRNGHVKLFDTHSDLPTCKIGTLQIWTCEFSPQRLPQRLPSCLPQRFPPCFHYLSLALFLGQVYHKVYHKVCHNLRFAFTCPTRHAATFPWFCFRWWVWRKRCNEDASHMSRRQFVCRVGCLCRDWFARCLFL